MLHALFLSLALVGQGQAAPKPADTKQAEQKQAELDLQLQMLTERYARSEVEWTDQMRALSADAEGRAKVAARHPVKTYWEEFERLASSGQARALVWLAGHADKKFEQRPDVVAKKQQLFRTLVDEHASDPWAMEIVVELSLQRYWLETAGVEALLNDFVKKTTNREFAAGALMRVMSILSGVAIKTEDSRRADEVRARILREYPETEVGKRLAANAAAKEASLTAGSPAPDFSGKDVDGAELGLASTKGKVVLLFFWGLWSPQSKTMLPHLRELSTRHAADPFVILGVNSDEDAARFKEQVKEHGIGWRSLFDGGRNGPVAQRYQVRAFPTVFLIDAQGLIRKSWVTPPADKALDEEIAAALAAAKVGAK